MTDVRVLDVPDASRYEARSGDDLAGVLEYVLERGRLALVHTEVGPAHQGRGIAGDLARFALGDARRRGLRVVAICPYVRSYLERHPPGGPGAG